MSDRASEKGGYAESQLEQHSQHGGVGGNLAQQLRTWHANRGGRSVLASLPPWPTRTRAHDLPANPLLVLRNMGWLCYAAFFTGFLCWFCDGLDYFSVPITLTQLIDAFEKEDKDITWVLTVTTLARPVGAVVFGLLGDRYGRRWTLGANMALICVFELGSGLAQSYGQFLAIRCVFGAIMGGTWPLAVATGLETIPVEARGVASGVIQQGYTLGNLVAAVLGMSVAQTSRYTWRTLYFFGAGFSLLAAICRLLLPESAQFRAADAERRARGVSGRAASRHFVRELGAMVRTNWLRCVWCVCFCASFCFLAHGSQDMYARYLQKSKGLGPTRSNTVVIISNCGAVLGGLVAGNVSQYLGRRFALAASILYTAAWIPLWILPGSFAGLAAGGFFLQSGVQAAWGIVPVYLSECSPPAFRSLFMGLFYQLGNMASGSAGQIEAVAAHHNPLTRGGRPVLDAKGAAMPDYAKIQGMFVGIVLAVALLCVVLGPEADSSRFENSKVAYMEGAGEADARELVEQEKAAATHVEDVEKAKSIKSIA